MADAPSYRTINCDLGCAPPHHSGSCPWADRPPHPAQLSVRDAALGLTRDDLPIVDGERPLVGDALL